MPRWLSRSSIHPPPEYLRAVQRTKAVVRWPEIVRAALDPGAPLRPAGSAAAGMTRGGGMAAEAWRRARTRQSDPCGAGLRPGLDPP
jgi:hypothetical protein